MYMIICIHSIVSSITFYFYKKMSAISLLFSVFCSQTPPRSLTACKVLTHISDSVTYEGVSKKIPDWPPGARTANGTPLCHYVQLYHYFVSQSNGFCCYNPLCCCSMSKTKGEHIFYQLSLETFGYTLVGSDVSTDIVKLQT